MVFHFFLFPSYWTLINEQIVFFNLLPQFKIYNFRFFGSDFRIKVIFPLKIRFFEKLATLHFAVVLVSIIILLRLHFKFNFLTLTLLWSDFFFETGERLFLTANTIYFQLVNDFTDSPWKNSFIFNQLNGSQNKITWSPVLHFSRFFCLSGRY